MSTTTAKKIATIKKRLSAPNKVEAKLVAIKQQVIDNEATKLRRSLKGDTGESGKDGREIELRANDEYIQWKYTDDIKWTNLVALEDLKGDKPKLGVDYFVFHGKDGRDGRNGINGIDGLGGSDALLENSTFTYAAGLVTRIDYEHGQSKVFTYNPDNTVSQIVWDRLTDTVTKTFTYNLDGTLASVNINIV